MTHTDTLDQHVREYYLYHDEQTKFFDDLASTNKPVDAGLDEAAALNWCEQMIRDDDYRRDQLAQDLMLKKYELELKHFLKHIDYLKLFVVLYF